MAKKSAAELAEIYKNATKSLDFLIASTPTKPTDEQKTALNQAFKAKQKAWTAYKKQKGIEWGKESNA